MPELTAEEQVALDWLRGIGYPMRWSDNPERNEIYRKLCGKGYARCRFVRGRFRYQAK